MPFTAAQKDQVLAILGYPADADAISRISTKLDLLDAASSAATTRIQTYLTEITAIEAQIKTARELPGSALSQLKAEGRRFTSLVATALSLDSYKDSW